MIKKLLAASLLSATLLPLAAPQAATVRWARSADPATLDPHAVNVGLNFNLLHQMYEPLLIRLADNSLQGAIATHWKQTDDPAVWEFKLRPDVKFHDGTPLTAADVVFSLKRAQAPSSQMKSLLSSVEDVVAVDPLTVHIRTHGPDLILPDNLTNLFIMSEAWTKAHHAEVPQDTAASAENYATRHVNGTGPYTLASREADARTVLKAYPAYWGKGQFPLDVTELQYVPIKSAATRVAALLSGEVDFLQDVPAQDVARLKADEHLMVKSGLENRTIFLGLDVGSKVLRHSSVKDRNPLADARVCEALALAIDRDAIRKAVMRGLSSPTGILAPPFVNGYTEALAAFPKADPARARQLLAEAGYPQGFTLTLDAPNDRYVNDEAIATAVAGFLGRIGVKVTVQARPFALHNAVLTKGESDFYLYGWGVPTHDSAYVFDYLVHTRGKNRLGTWNITGYSNADIDAQIESLSTEADRNKRNATIARIWEATKQAGFYIPLHDQMITSAARRGIEVPLHPNNITYFKFVTVQGPTRQ